MGRAQHVPAVQPVAPAASVGRVELLLIRHAQTYANVEGALDTAHPGTDLTPLGEEQVSTLVHALAGERVDAVWCSPRLRARRTALALAEPRGLSVVEHEGAVEVDAGAVEMSTRPEDARVYNAVVDAWPHSSRGHARVLAGHVLGRGAGHARGSVMGDLGHQSRVGACDPVALSRKFTRVGTPHPTTR